MSLFHTSCFLNPLRPSTFVILKLRLPILGISLIEASIILLMKIKLIYAIMEFHFANFGCVYMAELAMDIVRKLVGLNQKP